MNIKVACTFISVLLSGGCGDQGKRPAAVFSTVVFEDYKTPGRIQQSKEMDFKDCKSGGDYFVCKRSTSSSLLGVKAISAALTLQYQDSFNADPFAPRPPDQPKTADRLSYKEISFEFPATQYREQCVAKLRKNSWERPIECRTADTGIDYLKYVLEQMGWVERSSKSHHYYFKESELVSIHIDRNNITVNLNPILPKERDIEIDGIYRKINEAKMRQKNQDEILQKLTN